MFNELRADIATARDAMGNKMGAGREIRRLAEHMWEGETVKRMTRGQYGGGWGLVVLTDRRLLFTKDGIMSTKTEDFPITKISSVQWSSGIVYGSITIFASGNKAEVKTVEKEPGKAIVDEIRARLSARSDASSAAAAPEIDVTDQLLKLGQLRDAGVLSDDEFAAKKKELLARL